MIFLALTAQLPYLHGSLSYSEDLLKLLAIAESVNIEEEHEGMTQNATFQQQAGGFVTESDCPEDVLALNQFLSDLQSYANDFTIKVDCFADRCTQLSIESQGEEYFAAICLKNGIKTCMLALCL